MFENLTNDQFNLLLTIVSNHAMMPNDQRPEQLDPEEEATFILQLASETFIRIDQELNNV